MPVVTYKDHQIHYAISGKGTPVLLLHGFCEDSRIWHDFQTPLETDYQIITLDLPGFGQSDAVENLSISNYAEVLEAVVEALNLSPFILIGHSMGGYVALAFAEKRASLVLGLGLFHSHPYADDAAKKEARTKAIDFVTTNGAKTYTRELIPMLFSGDFLKTKRPIVDKLVSNTAEYTDISVIAALQAMRDRPDRSGVLATVECPVLFIIGEEDVAVPEAYSKAQTHVPQTASIHILPEVGHMGMFEAQKKTQRIVRDFLVFCTS